MERFWEGIDAVRRGDVEAFLDGASEELDRILAFGSFRIRARGSGVDTHFPVAGIATFHDGKLVRWEDFRERRLALEAAGLSE